LNIFQTNFSCCCLIYSNWVFYDVLLSINNIFKLQVFKLFKMIYFIHYYFKFILSYNEFIINYETKRLIYQDFLRGYSSWSFIFIHMHLKLFGMLNIRSKVNPFTFVSFLDLKILLRSKTLKIMFKFKKFLLFLDLDFLLKILVHHFSSSTHKNSKL
jgi:hypothetical protein